MSLMSLASLVSGISSVSSVYDGPTPATFKQDAIGRIKLAFSQDAEGVDLACVSSVYCL